MGRQHGHGTGWRGAVIVGMALVAGAGILGACGSSSSSTTTTGASGTTATTGSGSGDTSSKLDALAGNVKAAQKSSFQAVYTSTSGGSTSTITLAQSPPKQLFSTTDGSGSTTSLINTGTTTYSCTTDSGGTATCTSIGGGVAGSALTSLINVYNGSAALTVLKGWQSTLAAHIAGASLTFTDETIAGQPSTCAHWSHTGDTATYCVTSSGVLAKVESGGSSGGSSFTLTSYTKAPPASAFAVPQGATVVTIPTRVSTP
ncbi:MAG TPA: hypothetical protein VF320_12245 [Acidimicrobiales bacterium]